MLIGQAHLNEEDSIGLPSQSLSNPLFILLESPKKSYRSLQKAETLKFDWAKLDSNPILDGSCVKLALPMHLIL